MKFGVCIPHYGIPLEVDNLTKMAVKAEEMGFDSVWVTDHIIVPHEVPDRPDIIYRHDMLEPVSLLTHLGAVTKRVKIGTSVIILPYRNPIILAKSIATADVLSKGRVIFGAAIGWMEGEFKALNAPFANRGVVSDEYLQLLRELWTNPTPTFEGEYFQLSDVTFSPMPIQKPPPIWVGGRSRRGVRRAVRYGDAWYPSQLPPEQLANGVDHMLQYSDSVGRETLPELSFRGSLNFSSSSNANNRAPLSGTTEDIIADVQEYSELGVSHMCMEVVGESYSDRFRAMERFVTEVKPKIEA